MRMTKTFEVEVEILTPTEFLDHTASSPRAARELIQRLSQRLREADDRSSTMKGEAADPMGPARTPTATRL